jgi:hypothetical protein
MRIPLTPPSPHRGEGKGEGGGKENDYTNKIVGVIFLGIGEIICKIHLT